MARLRPALALAVLLLLPAAVVAADAGLEPVEQDRYFQQSLWDHGSDEVIQVDRDDAPDFGLFQRPGHDSGVETGRLWGELDARGSWEDVWTSRGEISNFSLTFELVEECEYALTGEIQNGAVILPDSSGGYAYLEAWDPVNGSFGTVRFWEWRGEEDWGIQGTDGSPDLWATPGPFQSSGLLGPGRYRLRARAAGSAFEHSGLGAVAGSGGVDFELALTAVPEPQTLAQSLASFGALHLLHRGAARARRREASALERRG